MQHPFIKRLVKLREDKETRHEETLALVVGKKAVHDLCHRHPIHILFHLQEEKPTLPAKHSIALTKPLFRKITALKTPDGIAALFPLPQPVAFHTETPLLICDGIGDPGNLGTLVRTAAALAFQGAVFLNNTVDPFHEKVLRASKGALFDLPYSFSLPTHCHLYGADLSGIPLTHTSFQTPTALIVGNEAHGITAALKHQATLVTIPMHTTMESLNVAAAGAILMYALRGVAP